MAELMIALVVFTVWAIVDYFNIIVVFDNFFVIGNSKHKSYKYIWLIYYFAVTYVYCISKYTNMTGIYFISYFFYYLRIVPFLWSKYGTKIKIPFIVFFYEEMEAFLSVNVSLFFMKITNGNWDFFLVDDLCATMVATLFLVTFLLLLFFRRGEWLNIWFANLSVKKYILLIVTIYLLGNLETVICENPANGSFVKILVGVIAFLISIIIGQVIIINERNYTKENIIGILEEEMRKLTGYYNELNKKDMQLRSFRHDTKNLLLVLHSMIAEGKTEQALEYIKKMEMMYQKTAKQYDTGNFIADALISSKAQVAEQIQTKIVVKGFLPSEKVDDVDMVVLLSNILDNALEACEKIEGSKEIVIDSVLSKQMWVISVTNPVKENINIKKNRLPTSKEDKDIHGYGLLNMEKVVRNYNGMIKLLCEKNEFITRATLLFDNKK